MNSRKCFLALLLHKSNGLTRANGPAVCLTQWQLVPNDVPAGLCNVEPNEHAGIFCQGVSFFFSFSCFFFLNLRPENVLSSRALTFVWWCSGGGFRQMARRRAKSGSGEQHNSYVPYARVCLCAVSAHFPSVSLSFSTKWHLSITFTFKRENLIN